MKKILTLILILTLVLSMGICVNAAGEEPLVLSNCDTTECWAANSQGMDALESDAANKTEGSGSVGATAINGKLNQICYIPSAPIDISAYSYLEFDIYFSDITWFNDCGSVMIELTSSGTNDKESNRYMKKVMRHLFETGVVTEHANWWHFVLELDDPQGTANGQLDKSKFSYFRFYSVDPISTTPDYTMRIDNMQFTNNPTNYQPMVDEEEDNKPGSSAAKAEVFVPKRSDPNLELTKQLKTLLTIEIAVAAVAVLTLIFVIVYIIVRKKKGKGV